MATETGTIDLKAQVAAAKTASNYIAADSTGIKIANANPSSATTYQHQTATNTEFVVDNLSVAKFGADGYQIGQDNESHMVGDYHSLRLLDNFSDPYFHVSDLRDKNHIHAYTVDLTPTEFQNYDTLKSYAPIYAVNDFSTDCAVLFSGEPYTGTVTPIYDDPDDFFIDTFGWRPIVGVTLGEATSGNINDWSMTVSSQSSFEIAMTFGNRKSGAPVSGGSVVLGCNNDASGYYSLATGFNTHAVGAFSSASGLRSDALGMGADAGGFNTLASGAYSHAEGTMCEARGDYAHAEGYHAQATEQYTHAEGNNAIASRRGAHAEGVRSVASEYAAHAEGRNTEASGEASHAQNLYTIAASAYQTAIGRANIADDNDEYALIIGNGTLTNYGEVQTRSNALAVTWTGIVETVGAKLSGLLEAARAVITKASGDTSTNALTVNDGTNDVLAVTWDGDIVTPGGSITPVILYDNDSTALNVAITLSETAANFTRLTICYRTNDNDYSSVEVWHPNGKTVSLTATRTSGTTSVGVYLKSKVMKIDGNKIDTIYSTSNDTKYYATSQVRADGNNTATRSNYIAVTQVIGYR